MNERMKCKTNVQNKEKKWRPNARSLSRQPVRQTNTKKDTTTTLKKRWSLSECLWVCASARVWGRTTQITHTAACHHHHHRNINNNKTKQQNRNESNRFLANSQHTRMTAAGWLPVYSVYTYHSTTKQQWRRLRQQQQLRIYYRLKKHAHTLSKKTALA